MNGEHVQKLLQSRESSEVEFKSSLRFDTKQNCANKDLTKVVVKSICGLLNANGGALLIGVDDDGVVLGIERDFSTLKKKDVDGFELTLRNAIHLHLGVDVSPSVAIDFVTLEEKQVAVVTCQAHHDAAYLRDGDKLEFYARTGNSTSPFNVREANRYVQARFPQTTHLPARISVEATNEASRDISNSQGVPSIRNIAKSVFAQVAELADKIQAARGPNVDSTTSETTTGERPEATGLPPWLEVSTSRVIGSYVDRLQVSTGWKKLYIVSPWLSEITDPSVIRFDTFLRRLIDDRTTVYLVTRPPEESWHEEVINRLGETGRVNIAYVPNLHAKLYTALTNNGTFALMGSANFTQQSFKSREIGLLVRGFANGKRVVAHLAREAAQIYRTPGRTLAYRSEL